ncbi:LysR family transcriptional regulator [Pseudovibrio japonicus]|uniref:LysR family transcriptional regulator n=1 Tax=Pseudovibrio japonicus TaxID=366534 RepID=A0ABQ3ENH8_9HYPH|nr:LysR family transcriptional regulator [Pseudovibrio japonicus]GHB42121.1 LysR family transcriptional regulator [Pseudovibrio japonicus]
MNYEQLVVLHAIVTEGTFRGAAERLHKSQSAISHTLKKLEAEIDMVLLSREAYRPKLTPVGEVFFRQAIRVMQQMNQLGSLTKTLNAAQEAEVSLAIAATLPLERILEVIGQVRAKFPATHIHLARESMSGPIERLLNDRANIIVASMDGVPVEQVEAVGFADVTILPVAHPEFEPAQSKHMKTITEMQTYTQIVVADSGSGALTQSRDLLPGGLRWTVTDFAAKKEILQAKLGWGGIPEHMIKDELKRGELVQLNVEGFQPRQSRLFQIRKRDRDVGVVAQSIWDNLMSADR